MHNNNDWWRGAVIYQVYPRSFFDSNGDGIGDLPGVTEKMDYIARLNVDAIWLSPFFTSPMKDFGYDVSDYRGVDPIFGTLDDLDELIREAHIAGLPVRQFITWNVQADEILDEPIAGNYILIIGTFSLTILGTFLTRSGVVASVHSFTQSPVGPAILGFLVVVLVSSLGGAT